MDFEIGVPASFVHTAFAFESILCALSRDLRKEAPETVPDVAVHPAVPTTRNAATVKTVKGFGNDLVKLFPLFVTAPECSARSRMASQPSPRVSFCTTNRVISSFAPLYFYVPDHCPAAISLHPNPHALTNDGCGGLGCAPYAGMAAGLGSKGPNPSFDPSLSATGQTTSRSVRHYHSMACNEGQRLQLPRNYSHPRSA